MKKQLSNWIRITLILLPLFFSKFAFAEFEEGKNALLVNFGMTKGGMAIGLDYEYGYDRTYGIGGYFRMYPHESPANLGSNDPDPGANGINTLGVFVRPHFSRQNWDLYVSPGFGFVSYEPIPSNYSTKTLLGPSFALGLLYEFTPTVSVGAEDMALIGWFGDDAYRGMISNEVLAKFRFIFK